MDPSWHYTANFLSPFYPCRSVLQAENHILDVCDLEIPGVRRDFSLKTQIHFVTATSKAVY